MEVITEAGAGLIDAPLPSIRVWIHEFGPLDEFRLAGEPDGPDRRHRWRTGMDDQVLGHIIDNEEVHPQTEPLLDAVNPWAGRGPTSPWGAGRRPIWQCAPPDGPSTSGRWHGLNERSRLLHRLADLMEAHTAELARPTRGTWASRSARDVARTSSRGAQLPLLRGLREARGGQSMPDTGHHVYTGLSPRGTGAIAPWNFLPCWRRGRSHLRSHSAIPLC